ncbi:MAG: hypothetical protein KC964_11320 [Candidatus Omnitrophica bacterium]|nr:hypothetical protein [Candidatus Omnitrophota bacterium]
MHELRNEKLEYDALIASIEEGTPEERMREILANLLKNYETRKTEVRK